MSTDVDILVIGAGVVGVAIARALAMASRDVLLLEAQDRAGEGISSRNSGVIHAGMYYPTGSLKARLCVRGLKLLYDFCSARGVAHRRLGKLIVATSDRELPALRAIQAQAAINGAPVHWIDGDEAARREPQLRCVAALDSPTSGIVDVPELITALLGEAEQHGARLLTHTEVVRIAVDGGALRVHSSAGDSMTARCIVNAAGLGANALASAIAEARAPVPALRYGQGHYYYLNGRSPFSQLIYPLPGAASLGVHLGMDLSGRCRFGPDMRWVSTPDYRFDDSRRAAFVDSIRQWWPAVDGERLLPDFVGVRPKLHGPGEPAADFVIQTPREHGVAGLYHLLGIESPGLTSSLAIAEHLCAAIASGGG
jgi:L-2-hydroxyglutarate oxidase LhgO